MEIVEGIAMLERGATELRGLTDRLANLEVRANRPVPGNLPAQTAPEVRAFINYVRTGVERLPADETRALTIASDTSAGAKASRLTASR